MYRTILIALALAFAGPVWADGEPAKDAPKPDAGASAEAEAEAQAKAEARKKLYVKKGRAFLASLTEDGVDARLVAKLTKHFDQALEKGKVGGNEDFVGEALLVAYRDYRKAMRSWFRQYHERAGKQLMTVSAAADNDYLLAHANYFLARADLQQGKFDKAEKILTELVDGDLDYFHRDYEVVFYLGLAQGQLLKREKAAKTFARFEGDYPDAPERYRVLAKKITGELKVRGENELYDLADRMTLVQRFLTKRHTGKGTQGKQKEIVEILNRLIKMAEEQEQSQQGSGGGGGGGGPANGAQSGGPASSPSLPSGAHRPNNLAQRDAKAAGKAWGQLKETDRKAITQFLNKNFPERYRHLLKQYYKELSKGEGK